MTKCIVSPSARLRSAGRGPGAPAPGPAPQALRIGPFAALVQELKSASAFSAPSVWVFRPLIFIFIFLSFFPGILYQSVIASNKRVNVVHVVREFVGIFFPLELFLVAWVTVTDTTGKGARDRVLPGFQLQEQHRGRWPEGANAQRLAVSTGEGPPTSRGGGLAGRWELNLS